MNRFFVFLPTFACLMLASSLVNAQVPPPPGCPNELIWTDGVVYVYDKIMCATDIGTGNCYSTAVPGIVFYDEIVTTGCKKGMIACECATDVKPLGHGGGGPLAMDVNGRGASKLNKIRLPSFEEYVAKLDDQEVWFKFYNFKLASKPGVLPIGSAEYRICVVLTKAPVKCSGTNSPCTPAAQFKSGLSVVVKDQVNGQPSVIRVTDSSSGGLTEDYKVVFQ